MLNFTSDMKKIFDLVFILEGVGLVTRFFYFDYYHNMLLIYYIFLFRISKNSLIYTGFRGMTAKLNGIYFFWFKNSNS